MSKKRLEQTGGGGGIFSIRVNVTDIDKNMLSVLVLKNPHGSELLPCKEFECRWWPAPIRQMIGNCNFTLFQYF